MGVVWSEEKGNSWWLRSVRALSSGTDNDLAGSLRVNPTALTSNQASLFSLSKGTIGATRLSHTAALRARCVRRGMEKLSAGTRTVPASLTPWQARSSVLRCFAGIGAGMVETDTEELAPLFFPLLCRQSGRPPVEFRGSSGFPGEMPAAAIPCVRDQSPKGEDPAMGFSEAMSPARRETPTCRFQTWPRQPMISTIS